MNRVGSGSVFQAGLQSAWGTPVTPDTLINRSGAGTTLELRYMTKEESSSSKEKET